MFYSRFNKSSKEEYSLNLSTLQSMSKLQGKTGQTC